MEGVARLFPWSPPSGGHGHGNIQTDAAGTTPDRPSVPGTNPKRTMREATLTRPDLRPNDLQRESVRAELHDIVDRCVEAWPVIERQAAEMGRGYPTGGDRGGGNAGSPVENQALNHRDDPALSATEWLASLIEFRGQARLLNSTRVQCLALPQSPMAKGRINSVEICSECGLPLVGKIKRLDNDPLHYESPGTDDRGEVLAICFWQRQRRARGAAKGA